MVSTLLPRCVKEWLRTDLAALDVPEALERHRALLKRFERGDSPALYCFTNEQGAIHLSANMPRQFRKLVYMLHEVASDGRSCHMGCLDGQQPLQQLHELLGAVFMPSMRTLSTAWPEQLQQDVAMQSQSFNSNLTEAVFAQQGKTALFVPHEDLNDITGAARRRDLVQRLEVQLLRWTQQTSDLLNQHRTREHTGREEGPTEEVQFWRLRTADLGGLSAQLDSEALNAVLRVLETAKSQNLQAFLSLRGSVQAEAERAASNLVFLQALEAPCATLAAATDPMQLILVLPTVLDVLRMVWVLSPHYNTRDQLTRLLRKVSNKVVAQCRATLDLRSIFEGQQLAEADQKLERCCCCAAGWRTLYTDAAQRVGASTPQRPWDFDVATIFAHVDAFVQRCRDLQELCSAQQQFACGSQLTPMLCGSKAAEVARSIQEVQHAFSQQMRRLQMLQYDVLDVRNSQWYEDMATFRSAARDLEQMLGNILGTAVAHACCLTDKLDVIEAFARIATRDGLRKFVELRMLEWHQTFMDRLAAVKRAFEEIKAELPHGAHLPAHAGRVAFMRGLLRRVEHNWEHLSTMEALGCVPAVPKGVESAAAYDALHVGLQQYINTLNMQWYSSIPGTLPSQLAASNLLQQDKAQGGLLSVNLSPQLQAALEEAYLFDRQRMAVPGPAQAVLAERHRLRCVWVSSVQVCRAYNQVVEGMSAEDRGLCRDRIRFLDRRVLPGVNKLNWSAPKHQTDFYHKDALRCCKEVAATAAELSAANAAITATCAFIRDALLVKVDRKRLYDLPNFEARQAAHRETVCEQLSEAYAALRSRLVSLYRRFTADGEDVQQEWLAYLRRADTQLAEALTACLRRSLSEVARALQGEQKGAPAAAAADVSPVFVLTVILDTNSRVELNPTLQQLFDTVHNTCKDTVAALGVLPRLLPEVLSGCAAAGPLPLCLRDVEAPAPFVEVVGRNEEAVSKQLAAITQGISGIVEKVQQLLSFHEKKYMTALWQTECTAYMRRYERANKPVSSFLVDIQKYVDLKEEVLSEDAASNVRWLRLDNSTLKQQLVTLCDKWVHAFSGLLASLASRQLAALTEELRQSIADLAGNPGAASLGSGERSAQEHLGIQQQKQPLDQQQEQQQQAQELACVQQVEAPAGRTPEAREAAVEHLEALHRRLDGERCDLEQRVAGCQEKYEALTNLQASIPDEELEQLDRLPALWADFVAALDAVPARLRELWA